MRSHLLRHRHRATVIAAWGCVAAFVASLALPWYEATLNRAPGGDRLAELARRSGLDLALTGWELLDLSAVAVVIAAVVAALGISFAGRGRRSASVAMPAAITAAALVAIRFADAPGTAGAAAVRFGLPIALAATAGLIALARMSARRPPGKAAERGRRAAVAVALPVLLTRLVIATAAVASVTAADGVLGSAPTVPIPNPIAQVHTRSGTVERTTPVPLGGAPVPIDVDDGGVLGLLKPDLDVSVGLVELSQLPDRIVVPNIVLRRDLLAVQTNRPAPPLDVDVTVQILDALNVQELAKISYGYATPPGERMPPLVKSLLLGPLESGFVDPLEVQVETPGYHGALDLQADVRTPDTEVGLDLAFDPIPARLHVIEDPREDGLDVRYDHVSPEPDVALDGRVELRDRNSGDVRAVTAQVERVPGELSLSQTDRDGTMTVEYAAQRPEGGKPDLEATYRETRGDGDIATDALVRVAGMPERLRGVVRTVPGEEDTSRDVDAIDFEVLDGEQIDALDFLARNWVGDPGPLPEPWLGPDQFVAVHERVLDDGAVRYRAAGRILGLRNVHFARTGADRKGMDVRADMGDGTRPLRALVDLDPRGPGAQAGSERLKLDATVAPLPRQLHTTFDPTRGAQPLRLTYETDQTVDVNADVLTAGGDGVACGDARVTCADVRIDKLPPQLALEVPGKQGTDYVVSHTGSGAAGHPDIRATVDTTPEDPAGRVWADLLLKRIPREVRGRVDVRTGALTAAEFHPCDWDYETELCADGEPPAAGEALGEVRFTVRDQPARHQSLPDRPDTAPTFVTLLGRGGHFEAAGRVREVREASFRQRDEDGDGQADGTLGLRLDLGPTGAFDARVDTVGPDGNPAYEDAEPKPDAESKVDVHVADLPEHIEACIRAPREAAPAADLPSDSVLARCDRTDVLGRDGDDLDTTPLAVEYRASAPLEVDARVASAAQDPDDADRVHESVVHAGVDQLNRRLRLDAIPPVKPDPAAGVDGRKLEFAYDADDEDASTEDSIELIDFDLESRLRGSACADPRPDRAALCLSADLHDLPSRIEGTYDPDETKGDIDIVTAPPAPGAARLSIDPLRISSVAPGETGNSASRLQLDARVLGITPHLHGRVQRVAVANGEPKLGAVRFDACPDGSCPGIELIEFTATNSPVGDLLPPVALLNPPEPGLGSRLAFVQRGEDFRATGRIEGLRLVGLRQTDDDGEPIDTTRVEAGFGSAGIGGKLRATVDTDDGTDVALLDAVVKQLPAQIELCFRAPVETPDPDSGIWCQRQRSGRTAIASQFSEPSLLSAKPDIDVRRLRVGHSDSLDNLHGTATLSDLGRRLEITTASEGDPEILLEGRDVEGGPLVDAVGRASFDLRRSAGQSLPSAGFPWQPLEAGIEEPEDDARHDGGGAHPGRNFLKVRQDGRRQHLKGSVPQVRRLSLRQGACETADGRYSEGEEITGPRTPDISCVEAGIAPGQPLGVSVRTRKVTPQPGDAGPKVDLLSLDDIHLTELPSGADGLRATIASSPEAANGDPACADADANGAPDVLPCRPPLLSVRSALGQAQQPELSGVILSAPEPLLTRLHDEAVPRDKFSLRMPGGYDLLPRDPSFPRGARIKVGTSTKGTAMRAGLKLRVPRFLDIDQPSTFTCKQYVPAPVTPGSCDDDRVNSTRNEGVASSDIAVNLVAANDAPLRGFQDDPIGRVALLQHDFASKAQVVVTGAPPATDPFGGVLTNPDHPPAPGEHDLGALAPAHLDARIYVRNDYRANADTKQTNFVQVDGRFNEPLSMALHLNAEKLGTTNGFVAEQPENPLNLVPSTALALRNAPGLGGGVTGFDEPTFRLRAELRKPYQDMTGPGAIDPFCSGDGLGFNLSAGGFGVDACLIVPMRAQLKWTQVDVNADPPGGAGPARTIDAVVDPEGATNNVDMRAFREVRGAEDSSKGPEAKFTPQAQLRLAPMDFGFHFGAGVGLAGASIDLRERGDLVLGAEGEASSRLRLSQNVGAVRLGTRNGNAHVTTRFNAHILFKVTVQVLFGLIEEDLIDIDHDIGHHPISFDDCAGSNGGGSDQLVADPPNDLAAISFDPPDDLSGIDLAGAAFTALSKIAGPIWCFIGGSGTSDSELVTDGPDGHPAPTYELSEHTIPGRQGKQDPAGAAPPLPQTPATPTDLVVATGETKVLCGAAKYDAVRVRSGGTLRVGNQGETVQIGSGPLTIQQPCDGTLALTARELTVDPDDGSHGPGLIVAQGAIGEAGAGTPASGQGGGAGAWSYGGASGAGGSGGALDNPNAPKFDPRHGWPGRDGTKPGGKGGGTIRLLATDRIVIGGTVNAQGTAGENAASSVCTDVSGGGGSGGAIELRANRVAVTGRLDASGGAGGVGGAGGGGGSGGRVAIYTVQRLTQTATITADGGAKGGGGGGSCPDGHAGEDGADKSGVTYDFLSGIERAEPTSLFVDSGLVPLRLRYVLADPSKALHGLKGIVCKRRLAPGSDPDAILSPDLDPAGGTPKAIIEDAANHGGGCRSYDLDRDAEALALTLDDGQTTPGFYGIYAFVGAVTAFDQQADFDCLHPDKAIPCTYQAVLPRKAQARVAIDTLDPQATLVGLEGTDGCPQSSTCVRSNSVRVAIGVTDQVSGPAGASCNIEVSGQPATAIPDCGPGEIVLPLPAGQGLKTVTVIGNDRVGRESDPAVYWFTVDSARPQFPDGDHVVLDYPDEEINGWHRMKPTAHIRAADHQQPTQVISGLPANAVTVLVDGDEAGQCGDPGSETECDVTALLPEEGRHELEAKAVDVAGNEARTEHRTLMAVDRTPPESDLLLGPDAPDGANGWYTTWPFLAFGTLDGAGGSGVDPKRPGSGVYYSIDGGPYLKYQRDALTGNRLKDGIHTVCWYAVDVAGNEEMDGDPQGDNCRHDIKVDTTHPTADEGIVPAAPTGEAGWYLAKPTVHPVGSDAAADGVPAAEASGIDGVELAIDDGDWGPAAATQIAEGEHVVRTRSLDHAGNRSSVAERTVRVDLSDPATRLGTHPPAPNPRGWFRRPVVHALAASDGRDNSGVESARFRLDNGAEQAFNAPFSLSEGRTLVRHRSRDRAGRLGATIERAQRIDLTPPAVAPLLPAPGALLLPGQTTTMRFTVDDPTVPSGILVGDDPPAKVKVRVLVYDTLGAVVRELPAAGDADGYRDEGAGQVTWNGRDGDNRAVLPGLYSYRVQATDAAGNAVVSTESKPFLVVLTGLPL